MQPNDTSEEKLPEEKNVDTTFLVKALVESGRKTLEHRMEYCRKRRNEGNLVTLSYYRKKLYKAILELRAYNKEYPKE
ncbi:ASC-1-like (ASCH) protein [Dysgonomonas sp. PH5-45]|uniref:hypothetical protein n=1 Tax=unclassified Dysgonomonas TaxID=2630389 RepID=UPI002474D5BE|nr:MULTISPECIES: hypothetical protein [unclassified Dysgonomonas]MDH6355732.1 ASC-1-like (ASCH) protein [Dysgonomonas sp. PH5-45]MDH6388629.1 ASC-1-like (ASCH) protein [Dysgonomonas sp. PH5-37]